MRQDDSRAGARRWGAGCEAIGRSRLAGAAALAMVLLLGACASPDWIDPGTWFEDDPPQPEAIIIPDDNSSFPNLATVPTAPPIPSPQAQRQEIAEGLAADRENARYSNEPLTADSTAVPEADPPAQGVAPPTTFDVANLGAADGIASVPLAPPPPAGGGSTSAAPAPPALGIAPGSSGSAPQLAAPQLAAPQLAGQPTLLQHQAYQQLAQQQQNMQQLALQRQAFEQEARQRALQQQFLRQQAIDQQAIQRRALELQARQLATMSPFPQASALQVARQPVAPLAVPGGAVIGSAPYGAASSGPSSGPSYSQAQPAPGGNLIGVIYFEHGSIGLDGNDRDVLRQVASLAKQSGAGLQVVGHASARTGAIDAVRHQMANFQVSLSRANRVAEALIGLGSPRDRVSVSAQADSRPVYHEFMPTGEAGNRRVEIYLRY